MYLTATTPKDIENFSAALKDAAARLPSADTLAACLGLELDIVQNTRASGDHDTQAKQTIDRRRLKELVRASVLSSAAKQGSGMVPQGASSIMPFGGIRGADPTQVAQVTDLLYWFDQP
jgi:hypothetical protein